MTQRFARTLDALILIAFVGISFATFRQLPFVSRVQTELEMQRCTKNLEHLQRAIQQYQQDYGAYPSVPGNLFPRYVQDSSDFVCPALVSAPDAKRRGYPILVGKQLVHSTYMHGYLAGDYSQVLQERKGETPVVICPEHVTKLARTLHGHLGGDGFEARHGDPPYLVVRRNGIVSRVGCLSTWRQKVHDSNRF